MLNLLYKSIVDSLLEDQDVNIKETLFMCVCEKNGKESILTDFKDLESLYKMFFCLFEVIERIHKEQNKDSAYTVFFLRNFVNSYCEMLENSNS